MYNQEDDIHHPSLTVKQTLEFALDTKIPGKRPGGMSKEEFKRKVLHLILKIFNIEHATNTLVGNAHIRGISGGERKRVSIAEMMLTGSTVHAWDNSTRGLDASSALDFAKSLRVTTNVYQLTTFVSIYQASENIYKQFDKVLVLSEGRQVYFGSTTTASTYFEGLGFRRNPRQTTPDFLTGCTDTFEQQLSLDENQHFCYDANALAVSYSNSLQSSLLDHEMRAYREDLAYKDQAQADFDSAHRDSKRRHARESSVYLIPYHLQIWLLMRRQFLLRLQDNFLLCTSWITTVIFAVILGTVWLQLPQTSQGAFTRGGLLFISLLFNASQAFGELAAAMLGRSIVNKHRAFAFYRPSALWIAQIAVDTAFASCQILTFSIIG
jgi:ATP-binding cassette subfamily G (WHITE) protein 2 (SNQ2)